MGVFLLTPLDMIGYFLRVRRTRALQAAAEIVVSRVIGMLIQSLDSFAVVTTSMGAEAPGSVAAGCEGGSEAGPGLLPNTLDLQQ